MFHTFNCQILLFDIITMQSKMSSHYDTGEMLRFLNLNFE